jgi:hypothetical protein
MPDPSPAFVRFLQKLDTEDYQPAEAARVAAELHIGLILGHTVQLSQTQAFDSGHFLEFSKSEHFRSLLREGHLRVCLLKAEVPSRPLCRLLADKAKVADEEAGTYFHLSGWPEIPAIPPPEADDSQRKELVARRNEIAARLREMAEDPRTAKEHESSLDATLLERWHTLRDLDSALAHRFLPMPTHGAPPPLTKVLQSAVTACIADPTQKRFLQKITDLCQGNRTQYREAILGDTFLTAEEKTRAREFVNLEYNRTVANSLAARANFFTHDNDLFRVEGEGVTQQSVQKVAANPDRLSGITWDVLAGIVGILHSDATIEAKIIQLEERNIIAARQMTEHHKGIMLELAPYVGSAADILINEKAPDIVLGGLGFEFEGNLPPLAEYARQFLERRGIPVNLGDALTEFATKHREQQKKDEIVSLEKARFAFEKRHAA